MSNSKKALGTSSPQTEIGKVLERYRSVIQPYTDFIVLGPMSHLEKSLKTECLICVDGVSLENLALEYETLIRVGDGDSSLTPVKIDFLIPQEKDISDLVFALDGLPPTCESLKLVGFTGGRLDHQLAALGEVFSSLCKLPRVQTVSYDSSLQFLNKGSHSLNFKGPFSLMTFRNTEVQLIGNIDYSCPDGTVITPFSSRGLSNLARGAFELTTGDPILMITGSACEDILKT